MDGIGPDWSWDYKRVPPSTLFQQGDLLTASLFLLSPTNFTCLSDSILPHITVFVVYYVFVPTFVHLLFPVSVFCTHHLLPSSSLLKDTQHTIVPPLALRASCNSPHLQHHSCRNVGKIDFSDSGMLWEEMWDTKQVKMFLEHIRVGVFKLLKLLDGVE